ncbi:MAG: response regulator [Synergistaceae bacterium]|jgi:putative two-component system response regulator|nr:response regulator [Synergistaceae bacterium]
MDTNAKVADSRSCVLAVDDTALNIDILEAALSDRYDIYTAMDGESALAIVEKTPPDIILLDVVMPGMSGYDVCIKLKENPATVDIPVIFLTAMTDIHDKARGFELGAVDYMVKPFAILEVQARLDVHLSLLNAKKALKEQNEMLEIKVRERTQELAVTQGVIIEAMASLAETRDSETADHVMRTRYYVEALSVKLREHPKFKAFLSSVHSTDLGTAATLHDIGKVGVPDHILLKPGRLTPDEYEEIKKHATYGHEILSKLVSRLPGNRFLKLADEISWTHHEKWDGSGYPRKLKGDEIPIPGRLMAIADVYDAIVSPRVYKPPMPHDEAIEFIMSESGRHFDPDVAEAFRALGNTFQYIAHELTPGAITDEFITEDAIDPEVRANVVIGSAPSR